MAKGTIEAKWPIKGLFTNSGNEDQPEQTSPFSYNVVPFDPIGQQLRGGVRPCAQDTSIGGVNRLHLLPRQSDGKQIFAALVGNVLKTTNAVLGTGLTAVTGGTGIITGTVSSADVFGKVFFTNAAATVYVDVVANTAATLASMVTTGTAPTGCTIAANFRSRLCLTGQSGSQQNIYMSRAGSPNDWDYSQTDSQAAVALNASATAGRVGQPVKALIPYRHDSMLIGCTRSLFMMQGDPADGGSIITISDATGILSADAWCIDEKGGCYFMAQAGLYRMSPEEGLVPVSVGRIDRSWFELVNAAGAGGTQPQFTMCYDAARHGVWMFTMPGTLGGFTPPWYQTLYYDVRTDSFWLQTFDVTITPSQAVFDPGNQRVLMCATNFTTYLNNNAIVDSTNGGTLAFPIIPQVQIGPHRLGDASDAVITGAEFYLGDFADGSFNPATQFKMQWRIDAARDAWTALGGNIDSNQLRTIGGVCGYPGRQAINCKRVRGGAFVLTLTSPTAGKTFSFEKAYIHYETRGRQR